MWDVNKMLYYITNIDNKIERMYFLYQLCTLLYSGTMIYLTISSGQWQPTTRPN